MTFGFLKLCAEGIMTWPPAAMADNPAVIVPPT